MIENVRRIIYRLSLSCMSISLAALAVISCIDVVPSKQMFLSCLFYVFAIVFVVSLSMTIIVSQRKESNRELHACRPGDVCDGPRNHAK